MLELMPAPAQPKLDLLPPTSGSPGVLVGSLFFAQPLNSLPPMLETVELGPVEHTCPICSTWKLLPDGTMRKVPTWIYPEPKSDPSEGWIDYPCHQHECDTCYDVSGNGYCPYCDNCRDCCPHPLCSSCECKVEEWAVCSVCALCDECCAGHEDDYDSESRYGGCSCPNCRRTSSNAMVPPWRERGWDIPDPYDLPADSQRDPRLADAGCFDLSPLEAMASFYLLDYVAARSNVPDPICHAFATDALTHQRQIIDKCDKAFRTYLFAAIGGELRHHGRAGRELHWDRDATGAAWLTFGDQYGRAQLCDDAAALFMDSDGWPGLSFGGKLWATVAEVLALRERGRLDPKTFVDRVFSLQHNSGSILNKVSWKDHPLADLQSIPTDERDSWGDPVHVYRTARGQEFDMTWAWSSTEDCRLVGEAHAAIVPDLSLLLKLADDATATLYVRAHVARNKATRSTGHPIEPLSTAYPPKTGRQVRDTLADSWRQRVKGDEDE